MKTCASVSSLSHAFFVLLSTSQYCCIKVKVKNTLSLDQTLCIFNVVYKKHRVLLEILSSKSVGVELTPSFVVTHLMGFQISNSDI